MIYSLTSLARQQRAAAERLRVHWAMRRAPAPDGVVRLAFQVGGSAPFVRALAQRERRRVPIRRGVALRGAPRVVRNDGEQEEHVTLGGVHLQRSVRLRGGVEEGERRLERGG